MTDSDRAKFRTVEPERRGQTSKEVVTQLRSMIHRGELRSGDRLPPERDLARLLGVSRPTFAIRRGCPRVTAGRRDFRRKG